VLAAVVGVPLPHLRGQLTRVVVVVVAMALRVVLADLES